MNAKRQLLALTASLALAGFSSFANAQEIYIPLISKGFQHQFWQAVKQGADQAAKDYKVKVTFEGPETEQQVDKQIDMLEQHLVVPASKGYFVLSYCAPEKMVEELVKHAGSKDATLRTYALHTLGLIGNKESAKVFVDAYKDTNPEVRKAAIVGIGFLMDKHSVNPIDKVTADNIDLTLEIMNHLLPIPVW